MATPRTSQTARRAPATPKAGKTRGSRWNGDHEHIVRRKWRAGMSSKRIAEETGWGERKIAVLCAGFRKAEGDVGGRFAACSKRREVTVAALVDDIVPRGGGRGKPRVASLQRVNAAVRQHRRFKETAYYTTVKDAHVAGVVGRVRVCSVAGL